MHVQSNKKIFYVLAQKQINKAEILEPIKAISLCFNFHVTPMHAFMYWIYKAWYNYQSMHYEAC